MQCVVIPAQPSRKPGGSVETVQMLRVRQV